MPVRHWNGRREGVCEECVRRHEAAPNPTVWLSKFRHEPPPSDLRRELLTMALALGWRDVSIGLNPWTDTLEVKGRPPHLPNITARDAAAIVADYRAAVAAGMIVERR